MIRVPPPREGTTKHGAPGTRVTATDGTRYVVRRDGALQRLIPKVKGKAAQKAHKRARRQRRLYPAVQPSEAQMAPQPVHDRDQMTDERTTREPSTIDTLNKYLVAVRGEEIVIGNTRELATPISRSDALTLAAWIVALADTGETKRFPAILEAVQNT